MFMHEIIIGVTKVALGEGEHVFDRAGQTLFRQIVAATAH
jgi:hypothetical protein